MNRRDALFCLAGLPLCVVPRAPVAQPLVTVVEGYFPAGGIHEIIVPKWRQMGMSSFCLVSDQYRAAQLAKPFTLVTTT